MTSYGFIPNEAQLKYLLYNYAQFRVKEIKCKVSVAVWCLTFVFADGMHSPPKKTYNSIPDSVFKVEDNIQKIDFGINDFDYLQSLQVTKKGTGILEIAGTSDAVKTKTIELIDEERIVSVHV